MNGAKGRVRGFMWPPGGDPHAGRSDLSAPIAVLVEFEEVDLGYAEQQRAELGDVAGVPVEGPARRGTILPQQGAERKEAMAGAEG